MALLSLVVGSLVGVLPQAAAQSGTIITITSVEPDGVTPITGPGVCYSVIDMDTGTSSGAVGSGCDTDGDGVVTVDTNGDCDVCDVFQDLRPPVVHVYVDQPTTPIRSGGSGSVKFTNFFLPFFTVRTVDAATRVPVSGTCVAVNSLIEQVIACDGSAEDLEDLTNGIIQTKRVREPDTYKVETSRVPRGYIKAQPVSVSAGPAEKQGQSEIVTLLLSGPADLRINTRGTDGKQLKGACYVIKDKSHGGSLGRVCDGARGDEDGKKNAKIVIRGLPAGHTYLIDQKKAPAGYRLVAKDTQVTTVDGANTVTIKNTPKSKPKRKR